MKKSTSKRLTRLIVTSIAICFLLASCGGSGGGSLIGVWEAESVEMDGEIRRGEELKNSVVVGLPTINFKDESNVEFRNFRVIYSRTGAATGEVVRLTYIVNGNTINIFEDGVEDDSSLVITRSGRTITLRWDDGSTMKFKKK